MRQHLAWPLPVAALLLFCATGCSDRSANVVVRPIPGTEGVSVGKFSISISPDERWLAFTEWVSPEKTIALPGNDYWLRITTLNLKTDQVVHHAIESIPANALKFSPDDAGWKREAGLEIIEQRFRPPGWRGSRFYFQPYFHDIQVALEPLAPEMQIVVKPDTPGTCSDCPPVNSVVFMGKSWDLLSADVAAVFRTGAVKAIYYVDSPFQLEQAHHRAIYRATGLAEQVLVEVPGMKSVMISVASVRVSPDARYLAYVVHSKRQEFFAGPKEQLFVRDLTSGREKKITTYMDMGNLVWSPDGERLYFAAGNYDRDYAVRVTDVAATFSK